MEPLKIGIHIKSLSGASEKLHFSNSQINLHPLFTSCLVSLISNFLEQLLLEKRDLHRLK